MQEKEKYQYSDMVEKIVGSITMIRLKKEIDAMILRLLTDQRKENDKLLKENINLKFENRYLYTKLLNNKNNF